MSCNDTNSTPCSGSLPCGDVNVPVVSAGIKISQLPTVTSASANDLFVIVDYSAQRTKNITFEDLVGSISGSGILDVTSAGTFLRELGSWVYFDPTTKVDTSAFYPMSAIDHTVIQNIGIYTHDEIDSHISATNNPHSVTKTQIGLSAVDNTSDLDKPISTATQTALDLKFDTTDINQYTTTASFNTHTSDVSIHFPDVVDGNLYLRTSGSWVLYTPPVPLGGPTSARPVSPQAYDTYLDTDLGYKIDYNPPNWVNATGAIV